jgi:glycerophosphoryl diester phosphodiesterase
VSAAPRGWPLVIAHRGASAYEPENSLAAFRAALNMGADAVELDVHTTAEGEPVVHHDPDLGGRAIGGLSVEATRAHRLANGEPIPLLREALAVLGREPVVFVEVKSLDPAHDPCLLERLAAGPAPSRYHVHSFDHRIVARLKALRPELVVGVLSTSYPVRPFDQLVAAGAVELWQQQAMIDEPLVSGAHARGVTVYAWTVDDPARMRTLMNWGVDGICTNRPDLARRVVGGLPVEGVERHAQ